MGGFTHEVDCFPHGCAAAGVGGVGGFDVVDVGLEGEEGLPVAVREGVRFL